MSRALFAAALVASAGLAGCFASGENEGVAGSPWLGVGFLYSHPTTPEDAPIPDDPYSGTSWWRTGFHVYEERRATDVARVRAFAGEDANVTVFVEFPLFLADADDWGSDPVRRLSRVVNDFEREGFHVVLVLTHPNVLEQRWTDPIGNDGDRARVIAATLSILQKGALVDDLDGVSLGYLGSEGFHEEWQVLAYHRDVKAALNVAGLPFLVWLDASWLAAWQWENGYGLGSVSPASGASDGAVLEAIALDTLPSALRQMTPEPFSSDDLWLLEAVPNCDLNPRFGGEDHSCKRGKVEEDVWYVFRAASLHGLFKVGVVWSDGGGPELPRCGVLRADAEGPTLKGRVVHDFLVGKSDPLPGPTESG